MVVAGGGRTIPGAGKNYVLRSTFHKNRNQFADDWVSRSSVGRSINFPIVEDWRGGVGRGW